MGANILLCEPVLKASSEISFKIIYFSVANIIIREPSLTPVNRKIKLNGKKDVNGNIKRHFLCFLGIVVLL